MERKDVCCLLKNDFILFENILFGKWSVVLFNVYYYFTIAIRELFLSQYWITDLNAITE